MSSVSIATPTPGNEVIYIVPQSALISKEKRSNYQLVCDKAYATFAELGYYYGITVNRVKTYFGYLNYDSYDKKVWKQESQGLYVFIHGLNGHPSIWNYHIEVVRQKEADKDIFVPYVVERGNCKLDEAVLPILNQVKDYQKYHPTKPIVLCGVSNGARIAMRIETLLRDTVSPIMVTTVAGVHFGSKLMSRFKGSWIAKTLGYSKEIQEEISYGSEKAREILDAAKAKTDAIRNYEFFATADDEQATDYGTALPILDKGEKHKVLFGYYHNGIVAGVHELQMDSCIKWMAEQNNPKHSEIEEVKS